MQNVTKIRYFAVNIENKLYNCTIVENKRIKEDKMNITLSINNMMNMSCCMSIKHVEGDSVLC